MPVLLLFVMGTIDFGMTFNRQASIRQAAREVVRDVTLGEFGSDSSCSLAGVGGNVASQAIMCSVKEHHRDDSETTRVKLVFPDGNDYARRDEVLLCVMQPAESLSGIFSTFLDDRVLTAAVNMRIEVDLDDGDVVPVDKSETALPGADWSFCA